MEEGLYKERCIHTHTHRPTLYSRAKLTGSRHSLRSPWILGAWLLNLKSLITSISSTDCGSSLSDSHAGMGMETLGLENDRRRDLMLAVLVATETEVAVAFAALEVS